MALIKLDQAGMDLSLDCLQVLLRKACGIYLSVCTFTRMKTN